MRIIRILSLAFATLIAVGCGSRIYVHCDGEDNDLVRHLRSEGVRLKIYRSSSEALENAGKGSAVLLLGSGYPDKVQVVTQDQIDLIQGKGLRVFAEFAVCGDLSGEGPELEEIGIERVVVTGNMGELSPMDLLTVNRGVYYRAEAENPLMVIARVAGFDKAEFGLEGTPNSPLVFKQNDNLWISTSKLSDFARLRFMPESKWKVFWEGMLSDLTGSRVEFKSWPSLIAPAYSQSQKLPEKARIQAVQKGIEWFFNGHFLIHPSWKESWLMRYQGDGLMPVGPELPADAENGDGTLGVLEGHCSAIYKDGRQAYRYWIRDDIQGESSMAFALAGELLDNQEYKNIAERLSDYSFKEFRDGPRDDPESPTYGLLGWAYTHKWVYYGGRSPRP